MCLNIWILISALFINSCIRRQTGLPETYQITDDSLVTVLEAGELESVNAMIITAPANWNLSYQIVYLPDEGSIVAEGDTVVIFDTRQVERQCEESIKQMEGFEQEYEEKRLTAEQTMAELRNNLAGLELQEEIDKNQWVQARYNSDIAQQDAALELEKTRQNIIRAREALIAQEILNQNDLNEVRLKIDQTRSKIELDRKVINDMYITSPKDGMVVYYKQGRRWQSGEKIKLGDTVNPQDPILKIPDPNNMKVILEINEVDRPFIKEGLCADIVIEAYPDTVFNGNISYISKIVENNSSTSFSKCYVVDVKINAPENLRLKPGLSAVVTLKLDTLENVNRIPSWCLFNDQDNYYLNSEQGHRIPVQLIGLYHGNAFIRGSVKNKDRFLANQEF